MGDIKEVTHWLLFFFVFGGLAILFLSRPNQTRQLMDTATSGLTSLANTMGSYVAGQKAQ